MWRKAVDYYFDGNENLALKLQKMFLDSIDGYAKAQKGIIYKLYYCIKLIIKCCRKKRC